MLRGNGKSRPPAEVFLHGEILRARPDINSVAHFHHDLTNVFTLVDGVELSPIKNHAIRWRDGIPVHQDPSHVSDSGLGRAVAETLGPHFALQIRAHGQVIVAESVQAVLIDAVHFVENAVAMYHAAALGKVRALTQADMDAFTVAFKRQRHRCQTKGFPQRLPMVVDTHIARPGWPGFATPAATIHMAGHSGPI